jgi:hypothetical protein
MIRPLFNHGHHNNQTNHGSDKQIVVQTNKSCFRQIYLIFFRKIKISTNHFFYPPLKKKEGIAMKKGIIFTSIFTLIFTITITLCWAYTIEERHVSIMTDRFGRSIEKIKLGGHPYMKSHPEITVDQNQNFRNLHAREWNIVEHRFAVPPDFASFEEAARSYLSEHCYGPSVGLNDESKELVFVDEKIVNSGSIYHFGRCFIRFRQVYNQIPVIGSEVIVEMNNRFELIAIVARIIYDIDTFMETSNISLEPSVSFADAEIFAKNRMAKKYQISNINNIYTESHEPGIYNQYVMGNPGNGGSLVWTFVLSHDNQEELILVSASLSKVSTKVCNLYFILTPAYTLSGIITDNNGEVCSKIEVEIIQDDFYSYYRTDSTGYYEIKGIPENKGYAVIATATGDTAYLPFKQYNISITQSIEKNITLTPALDISGYLKDSSGNPVSGVTVKGNSESNPDSLRVTTSNTKGFYKINNIPAGSDYTIKVEPLHYGEQKKAGQTAGTTVDFVLSNGGMISGYVKNTTFSPLAGIYVQISSDFLDKSLLTVSDKNGYFVFKGLSENDPGGNLISDYLISTASVEYLSSESNGHKVGDEINFTLTSGLNNVITGTLTDSNDSLPPEADYVRVYLYKTNGAAIISNVKIDANGQFEFNNLNSTTSYQIKCKVLNGTMNGQRRWAAENGTEILRGNAKSYSVGSNIELQLDGLW